MLQPFEDFKPAYSARLLALGRRWLVSQTYYRAKEIDTDPFGFPDQPVVFRLC